MLQLPSHRAITKWDSGKNCVRKGDAMISTCTTLEGVLCYYIATDQHNSEHFMKSVIVRGGTVTTASNIDREDY